VISIVEKIHIAFMLLLLVPLQFAESVDVKVASFYSGTYSALGPNDSIVFHFKN
jgi:hypothetical protein